MTIPAPPPQRRSTDGPVTWRDRVARARVVLSDWRYPAALAAAMLVASVLIAQVITLRTHGEVLDRLDTRSTASECTDLLEAEFDRGIVRFLDAAGQDDMAARSSAVAEMRAAISEAAVQECYRADRARHG